MVNDPVADLLTRIRNASVKNHSTIVLPTSNLLEAIAKIIKEEGYIEDFEVIESDNVQKDMVITLKYDEMNMPILRKLKRVSKPGLRIYKGYREMPKVLNGLGISIFSTPKGIMTGKQARVEKVGGEYLCNIW